MLYGRSEEVRRLDAFLDEARAGRSGALAVIGDPGDGKTALLNRTADAAAHTWLVLRCTGVQSESELPFAGLQLLLYPALDRLAELPGPHRDALRCAFGLGTGPATDRFAVGLATVALLTELASRAPVLCLIDDAQWLDRQSADALLFAAHQLRTEATALLFGARPAFAGGALPRLRLARLNPIQSRALLSSRFPELTPELRDRVLTEAGGNPLAILELPRMNPNLLPAQPLRLPERLRSGYAEQIAAQPESTQLALLVAAAEEAGQLAVVRAALRRLGTHDAALTDAVASGMITIAGPTVTFRHPLKRAAAYQLAPFTRRRAAHAAIAAALADDPDRQAWQLAAAAAGPDETVAAALDAAAQRARHRTAYGTAAAAFERAAQLTPERIPRARRLIRAVEALAAAGRPQHALTLADQLDPATLEVADRAGLLELRAQAGFESGALTGAYELWLGAAAELAVPHPDRAAVALTHAARAAWTVGDLAAAQLALRRMSALALDDSWLPLLTAVQGPRLFAREPGRGVTLIRSGVAAARTAPDPAIRFMLALLASLAADIDDARDMLTELAAEYGELGLIGRLPAVHASLGTMQLLIGEFGAAELVCQQAVRMAASTGQPNRVGQAESILAVLAALRGEEDRCRELATRGLHQPQHNLNTIDAAHCEWALLLSDLAHGRFESALHRSEALDHGQHRLLWQWPHLLADRVEAAVRHRDPVRAVAPLEALRRYADATDTAWTRGLLLRCQALIAGDGQLFVETLQVQAGAKRWFDHARTQLLFGEWLRRMRRLREARAQLTSAATTFELLRAHPWAKRARAELRAAGGTQRIQRLHLLTPQELQVVRLAARGATNNEIGAQLSLSPKTVGHHLYRAFPKLGVHSRVELARLELG